MEVNTGQGVALTPQIEEFILIFRLQFYHFQLGLSIAFQNQKNIFIAPKASAEGACILAEIGYC